MSARKTAEHRKQIVFWKRMANFWFMITLFIFTIDFFSKGTFNAGVSMLSVIYPSVLTIYVGHKEFDRWHEHSFRSRFAGETIILLWTACLAAFIMISVLTKRGYSVSFEMALTYLAVMSIYAVSLKSKELRSKRYRS